MRSFLKFSLSVFFSSYALVSFGYQVDLIVFAQPNSGKNTDRIYDLKTTALSINRQTITLNPSSTQSSKPYTLLPLSQSKLSNEYYLLSHKSNYQVLGQYSWRQEASKEHTIMLPFISKHGWEIEGTLKVQHGTYYTFNAELQCSPPNAPSTAFHVKQHQRIQEGTVYYMDQDRIGMIVKIS